MDEAFGLQVSSNSLDVVVIGRVSNLVTHLLDGCSCIVVVLIVFCHFSSCVTNKGYLRKLCFICSFVGNKI